MRFIGRTQELQALATAQKSAERGPSHMTVVTGRRRVGKTTLILQSVQKTPHVYWFITEATEKDLTIRLSLATNKTLGPVIPEGMTSLIGLIELLMQFSKTQPFTLIMDEFQNLAKVNSTLFSRIQDVWDRYKDQTHMHLILSGSSFSLMKRIFEDRREPLFGRAATKIHLRPFAADELTTLAKSTDKAIGNDDLLALYALTGGVALYVADFLDNGIIKKEAMFSWVVRTGSLFLPEGYDLLRLELGASQSTYFSILRALAHGQTQASRIADQIGEAVITSYLERLELYGFIEKMRPILAKPNTKSVRWRLADPFLRFWFRFIENNSDLIACGMPEAIAEDIAKNYETFSGPVLERFFREKLLRTGHFCSVGSWWEQKRRAQGDQNEIDIVAIGRNRRFALVAEVKRQKKSFREKLFLDKVEHIRNGALAGFELIPLCLTLEDMDSDLTNRFQDATKQ